MEKTLQNLPHQRPPTFVVRKSGDQNLEVTNTTNKKSQLRFIWIFNKKKAVLKNLLIVEDNPSMRRLIKSVVEDLALSSTNARTEPMPWPPMKNIVPIGS